MNIKIVKDSPIPAYRQIIDQIKEAVSSGFLKSGDKVSPERDLAKELGIARGTITKAYLELESEGVVSTVQGKGTFIADKKAISSDNVESIIDQFIDDMVRYGFSAEEIEKQLSERLEKRNSENEPIIIAAIDCNPEALAIFEKQLFSVPNTHVIKLLLNDIPAGSEGEKKLSPYNMIITTSTHFKEVNAKWPSVSDKLLPVSVAPTRETIMTLARLTSNLRTGVICESLRFSEIIAGHLEELHLSIDNLEVLYVDNIEGLPEFLNKVDAVITPPGFSLMQRRNQIADIQQFTERGGLILPFDYQIEKGSLLHLEERIKKYFEI
ncbi:MAG: GntR family transcriptional regulator [Fibrobacteres bacterium]|nr:GntR family transcriptional regulator [Fibrobacterota bacterium]